MKNLLKPFQLESLLLSFGYPGATAPGRVTRASFGRMISCLVTLLIFYSCQTKVAADLPPELLKNTKQPSMVATDFETFYTDSGVVKYHLQTPKLVIYDDPPQPYKDFPEGFVFQKYDINRKIISQMSGNRGKYFENEKKWEAEGNVVLVNSEGDTLRSEELKYHQAEDLIFSDQFVSIKKGENTIKGAKGFKSDSQMSKYTFYKNTGDFNVKEQ
jgi:LPS export ABC transporter protein LptC